MEKKLRNNKSIIQFLKFTVFSISAGIIQIITFTILNELVRLPYWPCYLTALTLSVLYNFTINRKITFKSASNVPIAMMKVALYYSIFTPLSTIYGDRLEGMGYNEYLILGCTMIINFVTEFFYTKYFVFTDTLKK